MKLRGPMMTMLRTSGIRWMEEKWADEKKKEFAHRNRKRK